MQAAFRKRLTLATAAIAVAVTAVVLPVGWASSAGATNDPGSFSATRTLTRDNLNVDGTDTVVSTNNFSVNVSRTQGLRGRQDVNITWSGAIPTGGLVADVHSYLAVGQEYPVAIMECRGTGAQVTPETCWTHGSLSRYISYNGQYAPFRLDRYATAADRAAVVGRPDNIPTSAPIECQFSAPNEHWIPFRAVDGTVYNYGNNGCDGIPPEDTTFDLSSSNMPDNSTFAATNGDGTGLAKFDVWTEAENASLGCSATVACSLMIVPIVGISCDAAGRSPDSAPLPAGDVPSDPDEQAAVQAQCEAGPNYKPGAQAINSGPSLPVSGYYWWSASNWRNRVEVPLNFAPVSNACDVVGSQTPTAYVYGSELMTEATTQWAPTFCSDPNLFKFTHVQTSEPLARSLLTTPKTSRVYAAFSSDPPDGGFPTPTVQAPVGVSGFSVSYNIDDAKGRPVTNLKLNARLLAKLMTESYQEDDWDRFGIKQYFYLTNSPVNITQDPEFQALNPGISIPAGHPGAATLIQLTGGSDVTYAVTSYIAADPVAMAWLHGAPDPWGMTVNPAYNLSRLNPDYSLPTNSWPILDTTVPAIGGSIPCENTDATPWLPAVAAPTANLVAISLAIQFSSPTAKIACTPFSDADPSLGSQWASAGRDQAGDNFVIGLTSLAQAQRYDLESAALESQSTLPDPNAAFFNAKSQTFVMPTQASLSAAVSLLQPDPGTQTWPIPYNTFRTSAKGKNAYPGTMLVYADVPTSGLTPSLAGEYSQLLRFAVGAGQTPGTGLGELPDGYLPLTESNGLGDLVNYTNRAAIDVQAQNGQVPPLAAPPPVAARPPSVPPSTAASASTPAVATSSAPTASAGTSAPADATSSSAPPPTSRPAPKPSSVPTPALSLVAGPKVKTPGVTSGLGAVLLPVLVGIALIGSMLSAWAIFGSRLMGRRR
jgi:hypothetical protein